MQTRVEEIFMFVSVMCTLYILAVGIKYYWPKLVRWHRRRKFWAEIDAWVHIKDRSY